MSNQDDFDVVKHGEIHPESHRKGYYRGNLDAFRSIIEFLTEKTNELTHKFGEKNK